MKISIILLGLVLCLPLLAADKKPLTKEESAKVIEAAIRKELKKPTGELTKADYEKVTELGLSSNQLTDVKRLEKLTQLTVLDLTGNKLTNVKGLEKLTQLTRLDITKNPTLTKTQIAKLRKALPAVDVLPRAMGSPILASLNKALVIAFIMNPNYIDMKGLRVSILKEEGCILMEFYNAPNRPLFDKGKVTLSKYGKVIFQIVALTLAKHESQKSTVIEIGGHASRSSKTGLENIKADSLSKGWAFSVREFLVESGMKKEKFGKVAGYGNRQPSKDIKNSDLHNNRISILVRLKGK